MKVYDEFLPNTSNNYPTKFKHNIESSEPSALCNDCQIFKQDD